MKTRILVAVIGIPILLIVLLALPVMATALLVAAMAVVAVYELLWRTGLVKNILLAAASAIMALAVCLWCCSDMSREVALIGLWMYLMILVGLMIASHAQLPFAEVCVSAFAGIVLPLLLSALTRIATMEYGRYYILIPLVLCFGTDSVARLWQSSPKSTKSRGGRALFCAL